MIDREILFRCFHDEDCSCDRCMDAHFDEYEQLNSMTVEELLLYACECFNVVLNKYHDRYTLTDEIMDLYEKYTR